MGNLMCGAGGGGGTGEPSVVTVLQRDGSVLEFAEQVKCSKLLAAHPHHAVCLARVMLGKEQGKMLARDAVLERGRIYALVPKSLPGRDSVARGRVEFRIPKGYRAKICPEEAAGAKPGASPLRSGKEPNGSRRGGSRVHAALSWSAQLDSITEVDD